MSRGRTLVHWCLNAKGATFVLRLTKSFPGSKWAGSSPALDHKGIGRRPLESPVKLPPRALNIVIDTFDFLTKFDDRFQKTNVDVRLRTLFARVANESLDA